MPDSVLGPPLMTRNSGARAAPSLLVLGDIDYDARAAVAHAGADEPAIAPGPDRGVTRQWSPLAYTKHEIDGLAALHARVFRGEAEISTLHGADATEEAFVRRASGYSVLHLATHGFFEREGLASLWEAAMARAREDGTLPVGASIGPPPRGKPLQGEDPGLLAGLILAGANAETPEGRADGILTAAEVARLPLSGCRLAVLSACETALGTGRSGEGMQSLRRAFFEAGADSVVSTLWRVEDEAAQRLFSEFYEGLWEKGLGAGEALRQARLVMLRDSQTSAASWGAFTLAGEWR